MAYSIKELTLDCISLTLYRKISWYILVPKVVVEFDQLDLLHVVDLHPFVVDVADGIDGVGEYAGREQNKPNTGDPLYGWLRRKFSKTDCRHDRDDPVEACHILVDFILDKDVPLIVEVVIHVVDEDHVP